MQPPATLFVCLTTVDDQVPQTLLSSSVFGRRCVLRFSRWPARAGARRHRRRPARARRHSSPRVTGPRTSFNSQRRQNSSKSKSSFVVVRPFCLFPTTGNFVPLPSPLSLATCHHRARITLHTYTTTRANCRIVRWQWSRRVARYLVAKDYVRFLFL